MKKIIALILIVIFSKNSIAQFVTISDANFVTWLQANVPSAMTGNQMDTTDVAVTTFTNMNLTSIGLANLTGIQYFSNLMYLDCSGNQLTALPTLPNSLLELICVTNSLTTLPALPSSLEILVCNWNQLNSLPVLPNKLRYIECSQNQLTALPTLPDSLRHLECEVNQLMSLPSLPSKLKHLMCTYNQLTYLPPLPNSLGYIYCSYNQLLQLPPLPNGLVLLESNNNQLTQLPFLPSSLKTLTCINNNIACFQPFPHTIIDSLSVAGNPCNCLPNYIPAMEPTTLAYPLCSATNTNGCNSAEGIIGYAYKDNNNNCINDSGDVILINVPVKLYNSSNQLIDQTISASNGIYFFNQSIGSYHVVIDTVYFPVRAQCAHPGIDSLVTIANNGDLVNDVNFPLVCNTNFDIGIQGFAYMGTFFPGQQRPLFLNIGNINQWNNLNCASGLGGQVTITVTGPVSYSGPYTGALTPLVAGNVLTYSIPDFSLIDNNNAFNFYITTDTSAVVGDSVCIMATITSTAIGDYNPTNNTLQHCYPVSNSFDPNFKEVSPINVALNYHDWFTYTIHFQNTGNAPAINIKLKDTLDANLDISTFQVMGYSHLNTVHVTNHILTVNYPNIILADSTSDLQHSMGFVQYRIKPKPNLPAGTNIKNTAYIYFDYNAPVVTNTTHNSFITYAGLNEQVLQNNVLVYPNPNNGTFNVELAVKETQCLEMFDMTGSLVLSQMIENGEANINSSHLSAGVYNLCVKRNGIATNKKLVILK